MKLSKPARRALLVFAALIATTLAAVAIFRPGSELAGGQTLPPPFWGSEDDVEYFPPGHKFKLQNGAEAQVLYRANRERLNDEL